ncbi:hypothetical protein ACROYT_G035818 [Oculina patagonica]
MSDLPSARHEYGNTTNQTDEGKNESDYGLNFEDHTGIDATVIINCALNVPLMLISILGNGLVLAAIIRTPSIRSTSMIMLSSLAVSDLLVGVIAQPLFHANELTEYNNVVLDSFGNNSMWKVKTGNRHLHCQENLTMSDLFSTKHGDGNTTNQTERRNESDYASNFQGYTNIDETAIMICVLNAPLMVISTLGNALVLAAIIRTPSIRSTSMTLLSSLAVSDLLVGVIAQPLYIANELTRMSSVFVSNLAQVAVLSFCGVSLATITAISLDRFAALHYHMRYASLVTKSRTSFAVLMIWLTNFALSSFYFGEQAFT